jgi:hypothetical protein
MHPPLAACLTAAAAHPFACCSVPPPWSSHQQQPVADASSPTGGATGATMRAASRNPPQHMGKNQPAPGTPAPGICNRHLTAAVQPARILCALDPASIPQDRQYTRHYSSSSVTPAAGRALQQFLQRAQQHQQWQQQQQQQQQHIQQAQYQQAQLAAAPILLLSHSSLPRGRYRPTLVPCSDTSCVTSAPSDQHHGWSCPQVPAPAACKQADTDASAHVPTHAGGPDVTNV